MDWSFIFFFNSVLFGVGLAMDAFSVSLANGLNEPGMKLPKTCGIAGTFAAFQGVMPLLGWLLVHTAVHYFSVIDKFIPWIALALLGFIGGKMIFEGIKNRGSEEEKPAVGFWALMVQGVATSIDALSVGFTIADYGVGEAVLSAVIIAAVTFVICMVGLFLGRKVGTKLAWKASVLGGVILIAIGLEIFVSGLIG